MKKVLVLDGSRHQTISDDHARSLADLPAFLNRKSGYELQTADIQHTALIVVSGQPRVLINLKDDIKDYDLVIFRNASLFSALALPVGLYLSHHKVPHINGIEGSGGYIGKIAQMFLFALNGLRVPDSLVIRNPAALKSYLPNFVTNKKLVIKDNNGIKGRRNFLVDPDYDFETFLAARAENYIIQPFIPNDGDYRLLFAGLDRPPLIFKRTRAEGSHLNNTSQGGRAELVTNFPDEALTSARTAAKLFGRELAGADVLFDDKGNHFILEVNETPAIASGFMPQAKIALLDKYIKQTLTA